MSNNSLKSKLENVLPPERDEVKPTPEVTTPVVEETKPVAKVTTIFELLSSKKDEVQKSLPFGMNADKVIRAAVTEINNNPALLKSDMRSLFMAIIKAAQLGLEVGSTLGHAYLILFKNKKLSRYDTQLILGYKGLCALAWRSNKLLSLNCFIVYDNDTKFTIEYGTNPVITHIPNLDETPGKIRGCYAVAKLKDGGETIKYMSIAEIEKIKARGQSANSSFSPWQSDYTEMCRKTVIRNLFKLLPISIEVQMDENGAVHEPHIINNPDAIDATTDEDGVIK